MSELEKMAENFRMFADKIEELNRMLTAFDTSPAGVKTELFEAVEEVLNAKNDLRYANVRRLRTAYATLRELAK